MRIAGTIVTLLAMCALSNAAAQTVPHQAIALGDKVSLVPGSLWNQEAIGPDGNTVIFSADDGDVVLDTGRHRQHADDVLQAMGGRPLLALVNSHWHLDHTTNNFVFLNSFPDAELIATGAIDGALQGFLARSRSTTSQRPPIDGDAAARRARFEWVIEHPQFLRAKTPLGQDAHRQWKGLSLEINVAPMAVTEADIWIHDPAARLVASGDLVTLPAPLMDTACPNGWELALARIDATSFDRLVPGHGRVLSHAEFSVYRKSFSRLLACTATGTAQSCAQAWAMDVAPLLQTADEATIAREWTEAYAKEFLVPGAPQAGRYCESPGAGTGIGEASLEKAAGIGSAADQVRASERAFARSMADRDFEAFGQFVAGDAIFFSGKAVLRGRDAVLKDWAKFFRAAPAPFSWEPDQVQVLDSGRLALSTGPVLGPDGKAIARFNSIWRLDDQGDWRIVFDKGQPPDRESK